MADETIYISEIIKHLKDKGYSNAAISGILGNIDVETGGTFDFQQEEIGKGKGYGLFQFDFMKSYYDDWLNKNKKNDSIQSQVDFMDDVIQGKKFIDTKDGKIEMLKPSDRVELQTFLKESNDPEEITLEFGKIFENPKQGKEHFDERKESASSFFTTFDAEQEDELPFQEFKTGEDFQGLAEREDYDINPNVKAHAERNYTEDKYADGGITSVLESLSPRMAGGGIMDFTRGGHAMGPGTGTSDSIPAFLSDGEFVMTADAVKGFGGGNREQGAQKLYGMMKKAEDGA